MAESSTHTNRSICLAIAAGFGAGALAMLMVRERAAEAKRNPSNLSDPRSPRGGEVTNSRGPVASTSPRLRNSLSTEQQGIRISIGDDDAAIRQGFSMCVSLYIRVHDVRLFFVPLVLFCDEACAVCCSFSGRTPCTTNLKLRQVCKTVLQGKFCRHVFFICVAR